MRESEVTWNCNEAYIKIKGCGEDIASTHSTAGRWEAYIVNLDVWRPNILRNNYKSATEVNNRSNMETYDEESEKNACEQEYTEHESATAKTSNASSS